MGYTTNTSKIIKKRLKPKIKSIYMLLHISEYSIIVSSPVTDRNT